MCFAEWQKEDHLLHMHEVTFFFQFRCTFYAGVRSDCTKSRLHRSTLKTRTNLHSLYILPLSNGQSKYIHRHTLQKAARKQKRQGLSSAGGKIYPFSFREKQRRKTLVQKPRKLPPRRFFSISVQTEEIENLSSHLTIRMF